ncbi:hypothetical protein PMAYCL1PPCAC_04211 [Pristionchus mayeri]|uniref:Uncharacterized protein n=1 Tax=Pristionchus mayeri TaxID=1317129 RepID=A0AAN4Z7Q4_9BILA|nr:hypothetical protein PMAYCL1PPCAC_04211 [Pristionchus mayeri]
MVGRDNMAAAFSFVPIVQHFLRSVGKEFHERLVECALSSAPSELGSTRTQDVLEAHALKIHGLLLDAALIGRLALFRCLFCRSSSSSTRCSNVQRYHD